MNLRNRIVAVCLGLLISASVFAGLETATYIHELVATNPVGATDPKSQGDDHVRMIKSTLLNTFSNIDGPLTPTHTELNYVDGVTSAIQTQLNDKVSLTGTGQLISGTIGLTGRLTLGGTHIINTDNGAGFNVRNNANSAQIFHISDSGNVTVVGTLTAAAVRGTGDSGTYGPTLSSLANVSVGSALDHTYSRSNNMITVIGGANITVTGTGTVTFAVSLPVASDLAATSQLVGSGSTGNNQYAAVQGDATNNRAIVTFNSSSTGAQVWYYHFSYRVL